jgi:peptidoglycan/xylan/chitin deacetylase (PgdA/CDA1 family)
MHAHSHCANHPSHEARYRCATCGTWVCERCAREHADRIFCSVRCQRRGELRRLGSRAAAVLGHRVPAAWSIALTTAACVLLAAGVGRLVAELLEVSTPADGAAVGVAVTPAPPEGRVVAHDGGWRLEVIGAPETSLLVEVGDRPVTVVRLDDSGRGSVDLAADPDAGSQVRVSSLSGPPVVVGALPTATPTPPQPTATATATPPASPRPALSATFATTPALPVISPPRATAAPRPTLAAPTPAVTPRTSPAPSPGMTVPPDEGGEGPAPPVLHLVHDGGSRLALTFDGATSANGTAELLELLRELDLEVTMFVTGEFIDRHPAIVRQAALAGHEFGNHTYSHPRLTTYATNRRHDLLPGVTRESLHRELRQTEEAFRAATGRSLAPLWRAPYGEENRQLRAWAMELGYLHCRWSSLQGASLDSLDWVEDEHSSLYVESDRLIERLLAFPRLEGGIVLMHLSTNRRVPPWTDLPRFADEVRGRGVQIGTVSTLLEASVEWRPWYERARARHDELSVRSAAR